MRNATLRQLKVFECVARRLSFTRAAEELHLSQPAVSGQVKELEGHAGLALFEQLGRRIYLTPAGTEMLRQSRAIIQQFRDAEEAMQLHKGVAGGRLNISVISAGDYFLPRLLAEFMRRHGGVAVNLMVNNRADLLRQLAENTTDLAIMVRPPADSDTQNAAFAPHPYVIVAAPSHPLARARRIPLSALAREPLIVREMGSDTRASMMEAFAGWNVRPRIAMELRSTETIKQAVMAGMGIAFLSAHTVALERRVGELVVLDVQHFPLMLNWYVVHRSGKRLAPAAAAFKEFLLSEGAALMGAIPHFGAVVRTSAARKPARPPRAKKTARARA